MYEQPTATSAIFELLSGEPWPIRIHVSGSGYLARAIPPAAAVGDVVVQQLMAYPGGGGFTGVLAESPAEGDVLKVGWLGSPLVETPVVFHAGGNV